MERRDNPVMMGVLVLGQFVGKIPDMVVVDQSDGADHFRACISSIPFLLHQGGTNQVADRLGAIHVALGFNKPVIALQQVFIE